MNITKREVRKVYRNWFMDYDIHWLNKESSEEEIKEYADNCTEAFMAYMELVKRKKI